MPFRLHREHNLDTSSTTYTLGQLTPSNLHLLHGVLTITTLEATWSLWISLFFHANPSLDLTLEIGCQGKPSFEQSPFLPLQIAVPSRLYFNRKRLSFYISNSNEKTRSSSRIG